MTRFFFRTLHYSWIPLVAVLVAEGVARADLEFPETTADTGEVRAGAPLSHEFPFINRGPEVVEITAIESSCGCLTTRLDHRTFQPRERGLIRLEVNTLSPAPGPHTWQVKLSCRSIAEDPQKTAHRSPPTTHLLRLTARVVREILVEPASITMFVDRAVQSEIRLVDLRPQPMQVQELSTTAPGLQARLAGEECDASGRLIRKVQLQVAGGFPEGRHEEFVSLFTNDPQYREIKIPVTIVKRPEQRLIATPSRIELIYRPGTALPTRMVLIRDRENQPVQVENVGSDNPAIVCGWAKGPGTMVTLRIQLDGDKIHDSPWESTVRVQLIKPTKQTILIPVIVSPPKPGSG